jgi:hypothetical protein
MPPQRYNRSCFCIPNTMYETNVSKALKEVYLKNKDALEDRYPTLEFFIDSFAPKKKARKTHRPSDRCRALTIAGVQCSKRYSAKVIEKTGMLLCYNHHVSYEKKNELINGTVNEEEIDLLNAEYEQKESEKKAHDVPKKVKKATKKGSFEKIPTSAVNADTSSFSAFLATNGSIPLSLDDNDDF